MMPWRFSSKWPKGQIKSYKQRQFSDHIINSCTCIQKFMSAKHVQISLETFKYKWTRILQNVINLLITVINKVLYIEFE